MTAVEQESVVPQFAHAVRGYDRYQVDDYIERLNDWATEAQTRAVEAEERAQREAEAASALRERVVEMEEDPERPQGSLKALAERATDTLAVAIREADAIRRRAVEEAGRRAEEGGRQATEIVDSTRKAVATLNEEVGKERQHGRLQIAEMMKAAQDEVVRLRQQGQADAAAIVEEGRQESARLLAETRDATMAARRALEEERRQADFDLEQIKGERAQILEELSHLRSAIHTLIAGDRPEGAPADG